MSAETLHRAAAQIRYDADKGEHPRALDPFLLAVADWLDRHATYAAKRGPMATDLDALDVARAYLGGDDE